MHDEARLVVRRRMRRAARLFQRVFTRTEIRGLEHIPRQGPLLILGNHMSSFDGPLVLAAFPPDLDLELVGPGDFKLASIGPWIVRTYGMTLIKRGSPDRDSLKAIIAHLKAGRMLAMFPEGGTWEKRLSDVKPGAAYVSQATGAPILPVGIGGTYGADDAIPRLKRPRISVTFGEVMPPVQPSQDRKRRDEGLQAASDEIMQRIYALLPPEDRARYDRWGRATYALEIAFRRESDDSPLIYDGPPLPDLSALGEFLAKPNLFRPMWQNARLIVDPFREARFFAPMEVRLAARALLDTLSAGDYAGYLPYRLGDDAAARAMAGLEAVYTLAEWAIVHHARIRLRPVESAKF